MFEDLNWGLPIIGYLFLAGVGAGAILVSAALVLGAGAFGASRFTIARYGALIAPLPVIVGTFMVVFELGRPFRVLNLFKVINLSPMSIGSWFVGVFIIVATLYALTFLPRSARFGDRLDRARKALAWICIPFGFGVAVYTAILIGAMPARPFWNSPVIALLFTLSALSGGVASIALALAIFRGRHEATGATRDMENGAYLLGRTDALLLIGELVAILLFILYALLSIGSVRDAVSVILAGGALALPFWGGVVLLGIVAPVTAETAAIAPTLFRGKPYRPHRSIEFLVPAAVLVGAFALRYVVVVAGQITGPVGI